MTKTRDIRGQKFGQLLVLSNEGRDKNNNFLVKCKCDCGTIFITRKGYLTRKKKPVKHCRGCTARKNFTKHGLSGSPTYKSWNDMKQRCDNPNDMAYVNYGGRTITYCDSWSNFENFLEDMGIRPKGLTLERLDVNKGYCPDNCIWADKITQANNTRRNLRYKIGEESKTLPQWARQYNISCKVVYDRVNKLGWPLIEALTTAVKKQ